MSNTLLDKRWSPDVVNDDDEATLGESMTSGYTGVTMVPMRMPWDDKQRNVFYVES